MSRALRTMGEWERLNFLLTNRIPRRLATRLMGRLSRIQSPLLTRVTLSIWRQFADDFQLDEARKSRFGSLQECFTRELADGARPFDDDADIICSPCDAIVGTCGPVQGSTVFQAKGFPYELHELIPDKAIRERYRDGVFVTLRLKSSMYHRFHAPVDCHIDTIDYIAGDTWNVNPVSLRRIEKLYCKNERAVLPLSLHDNGASICLVPVAAILVASIRLHCLDHDLDMDYGGPTRIDVDRDYRKGEQLGYFQHGSTIIVFADASHQLLSNIREGVRVNAGAALLKQTRRLQRVVQPNAT